MLFTCNYLKNSKFNLLIGYIISINFIIWFLSMLCLKQIEKNIVKNMTTSNANSKIFFYNGDIFLIKSNISFVINKALKQYGYNLEFARHFN